MEKLIKKILNEVVGVPRGIELSARKIYYDIIRFLENNSEYAENENEFELNDNYTFSDYPIDGVNVIIKHVEGAVNQYHIASLTLKGKGKRDGGRLKPIISTKLTIYISFVRPENSEIESDEVISFLKTNDVAENISKIAHELKHSYDEYKNVEGNNIGVYAMYKSFTNSRFGNEVVDKFIYESYFAIRYENLVRPSELYTLATEKGITKKDFINFLKETELYKILQRIVNKSYEDFREQLKSNMGFVNKVIQNFQSVTIPEDDEGKIDLFLHGLYTTLSNIMLQNFKEMLNVGNPIASLLAMFGNSHGLNLISDEDEKLFNDFKKKVNKYEGRDVEFFKYMIGENQYQAYQVIKKLGKIYSILPDGPETKKMDEEHIDIEFSDPTSFEMSQLVNEICQIILSK